MNELLSPPRLRPPKVGFFIVRPYTTSHIRQTPINIENERNTDTFFKEPYNARLPFARQKILALSGSQPCCDTQVFKHVELYRTDYGTPRCKKG